MLLLWPAGDEQRTSSTMMEEDASAVLAEFRPQSHTARFEMESSPKLEEPHCASQSIEVLEAHRKPLFLLKASFHPVMLLHNKCLPWQSWVLSKPG